MVDVWIMTPISARRDWLERSVSGHRVIRIAGTATTFPQLRSLMSEAAADVAVVDLESDQVPRIVRDWLLEFVELIPIVVLTSEPDPAIVHPILRAGVGGVLRIDASSEQIVQAIKSVASGLLVLDSTLMPQRATENALFEPLTPRENEVLRWLADGLANKDIAARLNLSEHTIKFHIRSILGKLSASSRTEAVSRGLRSGLIEM